ncbi:MAG: tetratricopeptide repeat protein [Candidatus Aminicenantes bacterium]|nr:tetratricopeptide repeat protein [Candidatus Aminicenantes bacterium]
MTAHRRPFVRRTARVAAMAILTLVVFPTLARAQAGRETDVEPILDRADALLQKGSYSQAIEAYLEASKKARLNNNLSRSYFGLSNCYFYLRDMTNARLWMRRVLAVDPKREVSTLFYPADFVRLFQGVKSSAGEQGQTAAADEPAVKPETKTMTAPAAAPTPPKPEPSPAAAQGSGPEASVWTKIRNGLDGKFELEFHYGSWGVNLVKGLFEESVTDGLADRLRDEVTREVEKQGVQVTYTSSENTLGLNSEGHNFGFGLRVYPGGRNGSFSVGLSVEKTRLVLALKGGLKNTFVGGSYATVDADASIETSPWTTHMSFRWEFIPQRRISPFFNFGVGVGSLGGRVKYHFVGEYLGGLQDRHLEDSDDLDFDGVEQKWDVTIPNYVPFLHLGLGVRGRIVSGLSANVEAALWNGLVLRGGVAYRF